MRQVPLAGLKLAVGGVGEGARCVLMVSSAWYCVSSVWMLATSTVLLAVLRWQRLRAGSVSGGSMGGGIRLFLLSFFYILLQRNKYNSVIVK